MIKRLRYKFIAVTMGALIIVFAVVFLMLNVFMQTNSSRNTEDLLETVARQDGFVFPPKNEQGRRNDPPPEHNTMRVGRFFYVKTDENGTVIETNFEMMFNFTRNEAMEYTQNALNKNHKKGNIENMQYLVCEKSYGKIIVFAERSIEMQMLSQLTETSLWVASSTFIILFGFSLILSKWAVKPVADAFKKQRQFVSDAGHELKTPLTVISANVDVLENEIGVNSRLENIKLQSDRMNVLIHNLLSLAKTDEGNMKIAMSEFNISYAVQNVSLEFESRAFEESKMFSYDIKEGLLYIGNQQQIRQLVSILVDNAIRHSKINGEIKVTLKSYNGRPALCVYNTGNGISNMEKDKIFDRFYRSDESRSRESGGYGLGLSIAKAITDAHKGKITVAGNTGEWISFTVIFY